MTISMTVDDQYKRSALDNLTAALDFKKKLPDQVFSAGWGDFGFFESDRMFVGRFVTALHGLLAVEGGTSACLTNLSARRSSSDAEVVSWFMDTSTTEAEFITKLRGDGPARARSERTDSICICSTRVDVIHHVCWSEEASMHDPSTVPGSSFTGDRRR